jgi:DNA-binding NtrC family response regulator
MSDVCSDLLIVEDDPRMREMLIRATSEAGFHPATARSAEQAMKICDVAAPQIVLLDLNLPGMDGMEFLRNLRSHSPTTQVIVLTGFGSLDAAKAAIRYDVADFLTKPCRLEDLEIALARAQVRLPRAEPLVVHAEEPPQSRQDAPEAVSLQQLEQQHIRAALDRNKGNRAAAAAELGISERTLYYRLARYQRQGRAAH